MTIFRNHFRFTDKQRWEESTRSGGFLSGGRPIRDHVRVVYADDEKYIIHTELNRDAKIGNIANFHELFAYLMDFLPQPLERVDWKDPQILSHIQIFRSAADPAIIFIHERGKVYEINQSQGTLLNQTVTRQGTVIRQIYLFDFFTPEKNLWLPRTVLTVEYRPRAILEAGYQGTDFVPYSIQINEIDEVKINEPLTESDFYVSVPKGCVVWDYRLDKKNPRLSQAEENIEDVVSWMDAQWEPHPLTVTPRKNRIGLIQVSGNVLPEISITPPSIQSDFGEGKPIEETKTLTITRNVRANKISTLPLPLLESLPSSVQIVEIKETTAPTRIADGIFSQSWQVIMQISGETVSRNTTQVAQAQVIFPATEYSSICKSSIPVLVRRRIAIDFPEEIAFGICMLGDTVDRKFFIRCTDNRPFRILSAQYSSELFKVKNIPSESGTSFWLEVSFNPLEAGEHQGQLEIETNHPSMKLLQIVLKGLVPNQG